jgi:tetratricopeptide (TPR) repeat protein
MIRAAAICAVTGAGLLASGALRAAPSEERYQVRASEVDGEWRCSIYSDRALASEVLHALARQCGAEVEGLELLPRTARVDVDLRDRPVPQALEFVLGSLGLRLETRTDTWRARAMLRAPDAPDLLREEALAAYEAALREFPSAPDAAQALLHQGALELALGRPEAACKRFDDLVERFPYSAECAQALFRAGQACEALGEWDQAAGRFAELLRLERANDFERAARLELARCTVEIGSGERALAMLDALDGAEPPEDEAEVALRHLLRARALAATGAHASALAVLGALESRALAPGQYLETLELSARSLEGVGRSADAARRWLLLSQDATGAQRAHALEQAARLALEAGDEVGVLFIDKLAAAGADTESATAAQVREARRRLGLETRAVAFDGADRLERAEELIALGRAREALEITSELELGEPRPSGAAYARLILVKARALDELQGVDAAISALSGALPLLADAEPRRQIYLLAGELLERAGRLDEAIDAYQGRL